MLVGGGNVPYDAADIYGAHMAEWRPYLWSPDGELNAYRDRIVSRVRDLVRNDGWASAAVTRTVDTVIGADFRPISKPAYAALRAMTGIKPFDHVWAEEFGQAAEAPWRRWSNDPGRYCDAQRNLTVSQMFRLAFRHKIVDGDALAMLLWLPERVGTGRAQYATTVQVIDPDRLSNPQLRFDQMSCAAASRSTNTAPLSRTIVVLMKEEVAPVTVCVAHVDQVQVRAPNDINNVRQRVMVHGLREIFANGRGVLQPEPECIADEIVAAA